MARKRPLHFREWLESFLEVHLLWTQFWTFFFDFEKIWFFTCLLPPPPPPLPASKKKKKGGKAAAAANSLPVGLATP